MTTLTRTPLLPTEDQTADYLDTRVDTGHPVRRRRLHEIRELFTGLAPGTALLISAPDPLTQLTAFLAAHHHGLVPVLLPRGCPDHRLHLTADALGATALLAPDLTIRHLTPKQPQSYAPGQAILLTSGTSGMASGCLHKVSSLLENARRHAAAIGLRATDSIWVNLPLHYSYALVAQALAGLVTGARLVLSGPPFTPGAYCEALRRHGVTVSSLSPYLVRAFLDDGYRLPACLRALTVGGDVLEAAHVKQLLGRHRAGELYLTYGLTEAGPRVATLAAHREPPERHTSVGLPLAGVRVGVGGEGVSGGAALGGAGSGGVGSGGVGSGGAAGELLVTTSTAMLRRVGHAVPGRRGLVAADTVATGDVFRRDDDGYLFFCGRLTDFVIIDGDKVSLRWVRELVGALPGVLNVRTEILHATDPRSGVGRQSYRLHITARETSRVLEDQVVRRLKEVLLRVEFPCEIVLRAPRVDRVL